jgi:hypothetical protein
MPEVLKRLEDAKFYLPDEKLPESKAKKRKKFSSDEMLGALKNWFPNKSSVETIRALREGDEL